MAPARRPIGRRSPCLAKDSEASAFRPALSSLPVALEFMGSAQLPRAGAVPDASRVPDFRLCPAAPRRESRRRTRYRLVTIDGTPGQNRRALWRRTRARGREQIALWIEHPRFPSESGAPPRRRDRARRRLAAFFRLRLGEAATAADSPFTPDLGSARLASIR